MMTHEKWTIATTKTSFDRSCLIIIGLVIYFTGNAKRNEEMQRSGIFITESQVRKHS